MALQDDRVIQTSDKLGLASPQLAVGTLALCMPHGATTVTVRADAGASTATIARYSATAVLSVGAQSAGEGSKLFDLGGDVPIPCKGLSALYFAVDQGTANWNFVFETGDTVRPAHLF